MTYTYAWTDAEQSSLKRTDENGNVAFVPADPGNRDYAEFVSGPQTADAYVAPPVVAPQPTALELLEARVAAIEADEISDDATSSALLTLIAVLTSRVSTLESGDATDDTARNALSAALTALTNRVTTLESA